MLIVRIILAILGILLLGWLFAGSARGPRRARGEAKSAPAATAPYSSAEIQDGEFEDIDERPGARGASR